jgi:hypothetical protein
MSKPLDAGLDSATPNLHLEFSLEFSLEEPGVSE